MAASGSSLFFTVYGSSSVVVCTMSGSNLSCGTAGTGLGFSNPTNIAISGTTAFIADYTAGKIWGCSFGGTPVTLSNCAVVTFSGTAPSTSSVWSIFASGSNVFFSLIYGGQTVTGCTFAGTPPTVTLTCGTPAGFTNPTAIFVDGSTAYVGESGTGRVKACAVTTVTVGGPPTLSSCTTAASGIGGARGEPRQIFISGSTAFVTTYTTNRVTVCTVSGSPPTFSGCQVT